MKFLNPPVIIITAILVLFACKKKQDDVVDTSNNSGKTAKTLLTQKQWKVSNLVSSGTDIWNTPLVETCSKDNQYLFRSDDSLILFDMANKCSGTDPDSTVSSYKLYNNNTQLILNVKLTNAVTLNDTADIVELNETSLKLNAEYSGLPANISFIHP